MANAGNYLYGFTGRDFQAAAELRGLGGAPVQAVTYRDVSAIVSRHPVQRLAPSRSNLEPHHRIVRHISNVATLVPAAFGHISETDDELLGVLRGNYDEIRQEIDRLEGKSEMSVKLSWSVDNIFLYFVHRDRELRDLRDRAFRHREPLMAEKLAIGERFEQVLKRDRLQGTSALEHALRGVSREVSSTPPRSDKTVCELAVLIDRTATTAFEAAIGQAAALFDHSFTLEYSGPWPAYSFVRLRLQPADPTGDA
jgi:hypothetical protein